MLSDKLSACFTPSIRMRGAAYFTGRRVRITDFQPALAIGKVRGTRNYNVHLETEGDTLLGNCDCLYFRDQQELCKHLWALLLAVSERDPQWQHDGVSTMVADPEEAHQDDDDDDDAPAKAAPIAQLSRYSKARLAAKAPVTKAPAWQKELRKLGLLQPAAPAADAEAAWPPARRVYYLLDLSESRAKREGEGFEAGVGLELAFSEPFNNGAWTKPKFQKATLSQVAGAAEPLDREILGLLCLASGQAQDGGPALAPKVRLQGPQLEHLLPLLCRSGRCYFADQDPRSAAPALQWDEGPAWDLALEMTRPPRAKAYELSGRLTREGQQQALPVAGLRSGGGLVCLQGRLGRLARAEAGHWLKLLQSQGPLAVADGQAADFLGQYFSQAWAPDLALPGELLTDPTPQAPRPGLTLQRAHSGRYHGNTQLVGEVHFNYAGQRVSGALAQKQVYLAQEKRLIVRDLALEDAYRASLDALGFKPAQRPQGGAVGAVQIHPNSASEALCALVAQGWFVEAEGKVYRAVSDFKVQVTSGLDWFELALPVNFAGLSPTLPDLLAALKKGQGWVRLGDGSVGVLPEEWLKSCGLLAGLGEEHEGVLRFKRAQAGLLDLLLAAQDEQRVQRDAGFNTARQALQGFEQLKAAEAPKGFKGVLRPYQKEGLAWMHFLRRFGLGGCLADDMGLGKTVQVLALLEELRGAGGARQPSLLVVPKSLIFNWQQEAARFAPKLRLLAHVGVDRTKSVADFAGWDVVLTTYGTLRRDIVLFQESEFDTLILDESQAAKNAASDTAKSIRLLKGSHRLALSGTPVENHLGELWTLFEFLNPGLLGSSSAFKLAGGRDPEPGTRALLGQALKPFILRRTKQNVAKDLPAKFEQTLFCEMEAEQRSHYDSLRDHYRASLLKRVGRDGMEKSKIWVLEALLRLRQAACHPGLIDKAGVEGSSAKLEALLPRLAAVAAEGHKALVFSQFTSFLSIVRTRLDKAGLAYEYLDGQTKDRAAVVQRFQEDPARKIFLISLKAGGVGLNLTAAEYVFLLDPWWNPAIEAQAVDRAHRLGQTRQVFAYRLVAKDTVEEKVLQLQETKRRLADDILNADENLIKTLTKADLEKLFS